MEENHHHHQGGVEKDIWRYVFGFTEMAVVRCAIELGIADFIETQQQPVTLTHISSALSCSPSALYRIMRFLTHRGIFKEVVASNGVVGYTQTPLSALLRREAATDDNNRSMSMAAFIMLESSPVMLSPWLKLSRRVLLSSTGDDAFVAAHGKDVWGYAESDPGHSKLIEDAMACHARLAVPLVAEACPDLLDGVESVVDIGGGDGTTLELLVKAFPWVKGINFDLPHVVSVAPVRPGVQHVGGDMFQLVPKADAALLMWVLHDWGDEECIQILRKCKEAIPDGTGKVIILEAILKIGPMEMMGDDDNEKLEMMMKNNDECDNNNNSDDGVGLLLDMVMMAHTKNGKERTEKQWSNIITASGFKSYTIKHTPDVVSIIQAFP